jgi:hypothetical protein
MQEQMRDTRRHLSGQAHALEDKVLGMALIAVDGAVRGVRNAVGAASDQIRGASASAPASVGEALDVRRHVRRRPWLAVGGAVALGFVCARFIGRVPCGWVLQQDVVDATASAGLVCFSATEVSAYLRWLVVRTGHLVESCWPGIQTVAAALVEGNMLTGREVRELMRAAPAR